jgi:hypothetical protein
MHFSLRADGSTDERHEASGPASTLQRKSSFRKNKVKRKKIKLKILIGEDKVKIDHISWGNKEKLTIFLEGKKWKKLIIFQMIDFKDKINRILVETR